MLFKNTSKRIMSICASGRGFTVQEPEQKLSKFLTCLIAHFRMKPLSRTCLEVKNFLSHDNVFDFALFTALVNIHDVKSYSRHISSSINLQPSNNGEC